MAGLADSVRWLWGISVAVQAAVCIVLFFKGHFRKLPLFTCFVAANVCQAGLLYIVYAHFGFTSRTAFWVAWLSEAGTLMLRILATIEVLHLILKPYVGIWGLVWRVLAVAFGVVVSYAAIESGRNLPWALALADRGFHLAFAVALIACLLLIRYYSIVVDPAYKVLLGGFCIYSCIVVLANTVGHWVFQRGYLYYQPIWQLTTLTTYAGVQVAWAFGLWETAPTRESQPGLLTTSFYRQISPQINQRLYLLNDQLKQFWRPGVTRH
jgi:hypothetical protein